MEDPSELIGLRSAVDQELGIVPTGKQPNSYVFIMTFTGLVVLALASIFWLLFIHALSISAIDSNRILSQTCIQSLSMAENAEMCRTPIFDITTITSLLRNRWVHMVGDSTARDVFHELKAAQFGLPSPSSKTGDHTEQRYRAGSAMFSFNWAPFSSEVNSNLTPKGAGVFPAPNYIYASFGLHDILYKGDTIVASIIEFTDKLERLPPGNTPALIIIEGPPAIDQQRLSPAKAALNGNHNENIRLWIELFKDNLHLPAAKVLFLDQLQKEPFEDQADGIHSIQKTVLSTSRLLQIIYWTEYSARQAPISSTLLTMACASLPLLFFAVWLWIRKRCHFEFTVFEAENGVIVQKIQSVFLPIASVEVAPATEKAINAVAVLCIVMTAMYIADGPSAVVRVAHKVQNYDLFFSSYVLLLIVGFIYRQPIPSAVAAKNNLLNRFQTEEWKGLMQVAFIWYHIFDATSTYNLIRVFVSSYVWMTGFGNFSFFQIKKDFSMLRIVKVLFRLNFLVFLVCTTIGREWMLYYICPLHSVFFLFVWLVARIPYCDNKGSGAVLKVVLVTAALFLLLQIQVLFNALFSVFGGLFTRNGSLAEWWFRAQLDGLSTSFGILFTVLFPQISSWLANLDQDKHKTQKRMALGAISLAILFAWGTLFYHMDKLRYNRIHPYLGCFPIFAYVILRNLWPALRSSYMPIFQFVGTFTLESYLLQLHLYMTHDAKMIIAYIPGYTIANFLLGTYIFITASYYTAKATTALNDFVFSPPSASGLMKLRMLPLSALFLFGFIIDSTMRITLNHRSNV